MAIQTLEGGAAATAPRSLLLVAALASAGKPGAPRDALPITLRGIGFSHASIGALGGAAAYARWLRASGPDSHAVFGCWRDMAILRREQEHIEARPAGTKRRSAARGAGGAHRRTAGKRRRRRRL